MTSRALAALLAIGLLAPFAGAEEDALLAAAIEKASASRLDEMVVTPGRHPAALFSEPASAEVVPEADLSGERAPRSLADALESVTGVMVQKTGYGQASPYLRGLTGFRTLLLVDGIRLNNAAFRDGPNQYLATVDHLSLARAEVVRGPSSVLYGSDSMGGTVNLIPREPLFEDEGGGFGGRFFERLASAERSSVTRLEAHGVAGPDVAFLAGVDRKVFGDLRSGGGRLPDTGYDEWDADARVRWRAADRLEFTLGFQHVAQDDVPRTHKTIHSRSWHGTTVGSELRRDLDQTRDLLSLRARMAEPFEAVEELVATFSWQRQDEVQLRDRTGHRRDRQGFTVSTLGLTVQAASATAIGRLTYGFDAYRDSVDSLSEKIDPTTGAVTSRAIQGPVADDATYDLLGVFVQDEIAVRDDFRVLVGVRGTRARADANRVQDPVTGDAIALDDSWSAVVGSLRATYTGLTDTNLWAGVSQGFRAPNLSDLTRLDTARTNEVETPSPGLDPERSLTFELGATWTGESVRAEVTVFRTELRALIQRFPTGEMIDGAMEVTKANVGDGWTQGIEAGAEADLGAGFTAFGSVAWIAGKADTYPTSDPVLERVHLDRLPPLCGRIGGSYRHESGLTARAVLRFAAKADRLSPRDEEDTQRIPPGGTPGYGVLDLSASYPVTEFADVTLGVENLTDRSYRIHGSGQNDAGRNLILTILVRF